MPFLLLIIIAVLAFWWIDRSRELFKLSLRGGKLVRVRGSISRPLLANLQDVVGSARTGSIRAIRTPHGATLVVSSGFASDAEQRLRNVFELQPTSQLSARPVDTRKAASDVFTLAWLLKLFGRR